MQPDEVKAWRAVHHTTVVSGRPSSPKIGKSIHENPGVNPVHQMTFVTSSVRPSASSGFPLRTPTTFGTR